MASITDIINGYFDNRPDPAAAPAPMPGNTGNAATDLMDRLVGAIRNVESGGNPNAVSPQGASGSMQIMPGTFRQYAMPGESYYNDEHRTAAAIRKIKDDWNYFNGDPMKVAAAYIGGRGAVLPDGTIKDSVRDAHGTSPAMYARMVAGRMQYDPSQGAAGQLPSSEPMPADYSDIANSVLNAGAKAIGGLPPPPPPKTGLMRRLGDTGIDLAKGAVDAGSAVTGLARLIPGVGTVLDAAGYDPEATNQIFSRGYSPARTAAEQEVAQAGFQREGTGFWNEAGGAIGDLLQHPSVAFGRGVEALPSMMLGATGARAAAMRGVTNVGALKTLGAIGEGAVSAGQTATQIAQSNPDGNVYAAIPAGVLTGLISRGAAAIPGFGDAKTAVMTGVGAAGATGGLLRRVGKGMISEGILQEAPQSAQEQMWQNIGTGDPLMKGVGAQAGQGLALGVMLGGMEGAMHKNHGMPNQTGGEAQEQAAPVLAQDSTGQMNLLSPNDMPAQPTQVMRPADAVAGPLPEGVRTPAQMDLFGAPQMMSNPAQMELPFDERRAAAPQAPATSAQLELPLNPPARDIMAPEHAADQLAQAKEQGAIERLDQAQGNVVTPQLAQQQDQIAGTLHEASNQPQVQTPQIEIPGQVQPGAGGVVASEKPKTIYEMQMEARRKASAGELLSQQEAVLLTLPVEPPHPNAKIEVPQAPNTKPAEPQQGEMFGKVLDQQPGQIPTNQGNVPVEGKQPGQAEMFDQRGNPTYAAEQTADPKAIAEQFGKEFRIKVTDRRMPIMAQIGRALNDNKISFDDATHLAEAVRAGKLKFAETSLASSLAENVPQAKPGTNAVMTEGQNPEAPAEAPQSIMGTPLEDAHAKNYEVTNGSIQDANIHELYAAAEEGDHPTFSVNDAEKELARRYSDQSGNIPEQDQRVAERYFNMNFPEARAREAYLRQLAHEREGAKGMASWREGEKGEGVSASAAKAVADAMTNKWKNAPQVEVVESRDDFPPELRKEAEDANVNPKAGYWRGKVYVIASNHSSLGDVAASILHEITGHHGLDALLGDSKKTVMNQIYNGNPEIRKAADAMMAQEGLDKETAVEEVLADMAEKGRVKPSVLEKIGNVIRAGLRKIGLGSIASGVTNGEVKEILANARKAVEQGTEAAPSDKAVYRQEAKPSLDDIPEPKAGTFLDRMKDTFGGLGTKPAVLGFMTLRQLVDRFGGSVPALKRLADAQIKMSSMAKHLQGEIEGIDRGFEKLSDKESLDLSKLMIDATMARMHPDMAFDADENSHLDRALRDDHQALADRYNNMPKHMKELYQQTKAKFESDWKKTNDLIRSAIIDQYRAEMTERGMDADKISEIKKTEDRVAFKKTLKTISDRRLASHLWDDMDQHAYQLSQMQGPYFPLMRFGQHAVVAKSLGLRNAQESLDRAREALADLYRQDDDTYDKKELADRRKAVTDAQAALNAYKRDSKQYLVEFYESQAEADARVKQIKEHFGDDPSMQVERKLREAHFRELDSAPYGFMKKLEEEIAANLPTKDSSAIKQAVRDLYIRQMPEQAALKQQLKRLNVAGVKAGEMRRAVISAGLRNSFNISRMSYGSEYNAALDELRHGDTDEAKLLGEEMAKRTMQLMAPSSQNSIINGLSNISYVVNLGLSPSFLALNLLQPWTVSAPIMAARHGLLPSGNALMRATGEVAKAMAKSYKQDGLKFELDLNLFKDDEQRMLKELLDRGVIDVTQDYDLRAAAAGQTEGITDKMAKISSLPAHHTEIVNRVATALAAYRLEKLLDAKNGTNFATQYAEKVVADTHLDYTAENAPRLMQGSNAGGLGKLFWQFKKYQQGMIYLNFKLIKDAIAEGTLTGESAKGAMYLTGANLAIAGAVGTPLTALASLAMTIAGAFGPDDKDKEYKQQFYAGLKDSLGETAARLIMKGAPAAFLNIDVSDRAGMGDILNPLKFARQGNHGQDTVANSLFALAGPTASLAANWYDGIDALMHGKPMDAARVVAPRFMQGPIDAYRMADQGLQTQRGNTYMKPEDLSAWDIASKALTFKSADVADLQDSRRALDNASHARDAARHELINEYAKTSLQGGDMDAIRQKIAEFNERHQGERGVVINQSALLKARQSQKQYERDLRNGVRVTKQNRALADELGIRK
jgi:hypothetical protein